MSRIHLLIASFAISVITLAACSGPDSIPNGNDLLNALSGLEVPLDWELVSEKVVDLPCTNVMDTCPLAERIYQVEADSAFVQDAVQMLAGAGMQTDRLGRTCETPENGCEVWGHRGNVIVTVLVTESDGSSLSVSVGAAEFAP